jgi:regulator of RNase E activity RraB
MTYTPKFPSYAHQKKSFAAWGDRKFFGLLMSMRTGKSKVTIDKFGTWESEDKIDDICVIAPAGVYETWLTAFKEHADDALLSRLMTFKWSSSKMKSKAAIKNVENFLGAADSVFPRLLLINVEALSKVKAARELIVKFVKQRRCLVAVDECFVAGTKITTVSGQVEIQNLKIGDIVQSTDGQSRIENILEKKTEILVRIELSDGSVIKTTPNHPFFTDVGWVCAGNLKGRILYDRDQALQLVQSKISGRSNAKILREILLSEMANASTGNKSGDFYCREKRENEQGFEEQAFGNFVLEQRYSDESCVAQEAEFNAKSNGPFTESSRRQWSADAYGSKSSFGKIRLALETRACHRIGRQATELSNMLQSRLGECGKEVGNRVRRWQSPSDITTNAGRKERPEIKIIRVESVTIEKLSSPIAVFDIELEKTPHFFAEGVLVHNSTTIKNATSERTAFINERVAPIAARKVILTGLPTPRSPLDAFCQFQFLDQSILGFDNFTAFSARYATTYKICMLPTHVLTARLTQVAGDKFTLPGIGRVSAKDLGRDQILSELTKRGVYVPSVPVTSGYKNEDELNEKIMAHSYRVLLSDCYDLPPKIYMKRKVELTEDQERIYQELKTFATAELNDLGEHVTATHVMTRIMRLHQVLCGHTIDENGVEHAIKENRTKEVLNALEEYDGKAIIWCSYDHDVRKISEALTKEYGEGSVARFWGGNRATREIEENKFKSEKNCRFMIATPDAGGRGRTWSNADLLIYYSNKNNLEHRAQSEERGDESGKMQQICCVDLVVEGTVDEKIIEALRGKIDMAARVTGDNWREWLI